MHGGRTQQLHGEHAAGGHGEAEGPPREGRHVQVPHGGHRGRGQGGGRLAHLALEAHRGDGHDDVRHPRAEPTDEGRSQPAGGRQRGAADQPAFLGPRPCRRAYRQGQRLLAAKWRGGRPRLRVGHGRPDDAPGLRRARHPYLGGALRPGSRLQSGGHELRHRQAGPRHPLRGHHRRHVLRCGQAGHNPRRQGPQRQRLGFLRLVHRCAGLGQHFLDQARNRQCEPWRAGDSPERVHRHRRVGGQRRDGRGGRRQRERRRLRLLAGVRAERHHRGRHNVE
mmetsp:Transcript_59126/g.183577  ORF Transcript_59126/g.183577 Transcript_59126/m.183577 type:complete len:280 (+) Transcript_59126:397-1236(+)